MKRCDVAFGEWKPARNSGRVGNISLCQRVLVACCNKSPAQLEALMRSYQADDRLFLPSNADAEEVEFAKMQMSFCNAYLYLQFMHMSGASNTHLEFITDTINLLISRCATAQDINRIMPTLYVSYVEYYATRIADRQQYSHLVCDVLDRLYSVFFSGYDAQTLSVASLAEQFHVSVKYLSTRFIRETGCALSKQINEIRIYFAKVYLERTSLPLAEIAERSGVSSQNYFARRFKASVGMSPLQYRAQVR